MTTDGTQTDSVRADAAGAAGSGGEPPRRRFSLFFPLVTGALLLGAILLTATLGNPLGRPTGLEGFAHRVDVGRVSVATFGPGRSFGETASWADAYVGALSARLGLQAGAVSVRLLPTRREYLRYGREAIPGFHDGMDFCYSPALRAIYGWEAPERELRPRLQHELLHAVVRSAPGPRWPVWLEEGLGELLEDMEMQDDGTLALQRVQVDRMREMGRMAVREGIVNPDTLALRGNAAFAGDQGGRAYSIAYSVVLMLEREGRLQEALQAASIRIDPERYRAFVTDQRAWHRALPPATTAPPPNAWHVRTRMP